MDRSLLRIKFFIITSIALLMLSLGTRTPSQQNEGQPFLSLTSSLGQNRALFMQGVFYFEQGEYEKALSYFESLKNQYKELEDYVLYYLGQTWHHLEKYAEALSIYQQMLKTYPENPLIPEVRKSIAEILIQIQKYAEATKMLQELLDTPGLDKGEVLHKLGQSLEGEKNWKEAAEIYQQLFIYYPKHNRAAEAEKRMNWILKETGLSKPALTEQMLYDGAKALVGIKAYQQAIDLYQTLISQFPQGSQLVEAFFGMAEAYRRSGKKAERAKLLNQIATDYKNDENIVARALYEIGSKETLLKILTNYSKSIWADKSLYLLGQLNEKEKGFKAAASWYSKLLEQYPDSSLVEEALWYSGWNYYQAGEYQKAEAQFSKVTSNFQNYRDDALYWGGRSAEKQHKIEKARENYQELVSTHEESYYRILAESRLKALNQKAEDKQLKIEIGGGSGNKGQISSAYAGKSLDLFTTDRWLTLMSSLKGKIDSKTYDRASTRLPKALELGWVNLINYATRELQYILEGYPSQIPPSQEDLLFRYLMSYAYYEVKDYLSCIKLASQVAWNLKQFQLTNFPYDVQRLKYPLVYWEEIQKHAATNQLNPFLVAGLIRQESAYNVKALSTSNAMGLMQIIPPTGKYIAEKIKFKGFTPNLLYEPEINLIFGTWYLSYLIDRFDGNLVKAIAGYNAGPGAIGRWWKEFEHLDFDEIVENIPFQETKNYVKLVLRNWAIYQKIYGKEAS